MNVHALEVYVGLCRNLHFGRTSHEFHLSPSALSRMVRRLEESVGHQLLLRDNRSVSLTEQGEIYRQFAIETLANWNQLKIDLGIAEDKLSGKLTLFASVTASQSILPKVLTKFRREFPDIHIQLETGDAVNAIQVLKDGCDVVVAALTESDDQYLTKKIITSTPILTVAPISAVAGQSSRSTNEFNWADMPLILPSYGQVRENIDTWLQKNHQQFDVYSEVSGNEAILSLVALGCGVGFVPALVLQNSPLKNQVTIIRNGPDLENFHVGFCTRDKSLQTSRIIQAFWASI